MKPGLTSVLLGWLKRGTFAVAVVVALLVAGLLYVVPRVAIDRPASIHLFGAGAPQAGIVVKLNGEPIGRAAFSSRPSTRVVPFEGQPIRTLELNPEGQPGTRFTLSRVVIAYGSSVVSDRQGAELGVLRIAGIARARADAVGIRGTLTKEQAAITDTLQPPLVVPNKIGALQRWLLGSPQPAVMPNVWVIALLLGLMLPLLGSRRGTTLGVAAGVGVWVLAYASYKLMPQIVGPNPPVALAVGAASYFGTPYTGQQIAAWVSALSILAAATALYLYRRDGRRDTTPPEARSLSRSERPRAREEPDLSSSRHRARGGLIVFWGWLGLSLTLLPGLGAPSSDPVLPGWDVGNFTAWSFFGQHGLVPMRDYWFPYGFYQWFSSQVPLGGLWAWLVNIAMLALLAWSLWRLSGRRPGRVVICLVAAVLISSLGTGVWRYLPGFLVAATYAAIGPARGRLRSEHLVLFAACALALFVEADVLLMGLVGAALVLFGELLFGRLRAKPAAVVRGLLLDAVPVVGAVALLVVAWLATGSLGENLDFFLHLNEVAAYVATDQRAAGLLTHLSLEPTAIAVAAMLPFLLLVAGLAQGFAGSKQPANVGASRLLLAASGPALLILTRSLARPNELMYQMPMVALCCTAILLWNRRVLVSAALTGAFAGALFAGLQLNDGLRTYLSAAGETPVRAVDSLNYVTRPDAMRYAREEAFAFRRFKGWPEAGLADQLRFVSGSQRPSFAALGDAPILYVWFRERPPYHIDLYDSAPIRQQKRMIDRLKRDRPKYLAWDQDPFAVDGVPYLVRDPLIFAYAVDHYVPVRVGRRNCASEVSCTGGEILTQRRPGQRVAFHYWQSRLGNQVNLGFVPSYAKLPDEPCADGESCASYAVIRGNASQAGQQVAIDVSSHDKPFTVLISVRRGTHSYTVRLDRLWFWHLLRQPARLSVPPGWSVEEKEGKSDGRLY